MNPMPFPSVLVYAIVVILLLASVSVIGLTLLQVVRWMFA